MEKKILIVGGGLAGLCLGAQLFRKNVSFQIWNSQTIPCASEKAAGLMNPVVVKRLLKTWMAEEVLPYNRAFYPEWERMTDSRFYAAIGLYRMFPNDLVEGEWNQRVGDGTLSEFLSPEIYSYSPESFTGPGLRGADILQGSLVDCGIFVPAMRAFFMQHESFKIQTIDYSRILPQENGYLVNNEFFSEIVFCEGIQGLQNPWFGKLPLLPTKGELLYLDIPGLPREKEVMKGVFLAPLIQGGFVCGSTYDWQFEDVEPTEIGKQKILEGLHQLTDKPYTITKHTACVRPASRDRRPFLGEHPKMKGMFVFNGLGTKGYMLAPYLSERLANLILKNIPLEREMSITRLKVPL